MRAVRSGIRWLCEDGYRCRAGEPIAYCNIGFRPPPGAGAPFRREGRTLQAVFAPTVGGVVRRRQVFGGWIDQLDFFTWQPDFVIAEIDAEADLATTAGAEGLTARVTILAGLPAASLLADRSKLQSGWNLNNRAWIGGRGEGGTLLCAGMCDATGVIRGEEGAFLELMRDIAGPAHVICWNDTPLPATARHLVDAAQRGDTENAAIAEDLARAVGPSADPTDWMFGALLLTQLKDSPLTNRHDILTAGAVTQSAPPHAVVLSLGNEGRWRRRHRRLGYTIYMHEFRVENAGEGVRAWLRDAFEPLRLTIDDVRDDYLALVRRVRDPDTGRPDAAILILNLMASDGADDIQSYVGLEPALGDVVRSVSSKEANLMLHDLAREADVSIVDVDLIAAGLGGRAHLPDTLHASGLLQAELRAEILHILRRRGVPGFGPSGFS